MIPHVTLLYGGLLLLLTVILSGNVSRVRVSEGNLFTTSTPTPRLHLAIRAHGNLAEQVAVAIVMLLALELSGAPSLWLHVLGGGYTLCRLGHAVGLLTQTELQAVSAIASLPFLAGEAIYALVLHFR